MGEKQKGIRRLKEFLLDVIKSEPELVKEFLDVEFVPEKHLTTGGRTDCNFYTTP